MATAEEKAAQKAAKEKEQADALIAELAPFNVELTGNETVKELKDKLKQAKADAKAAQKAANVADATEASVMHNGRLVRLYTLSIHGEDFAALAEEFASDRDGHEVVLK